MMPILTLLILLIVPGLGWGTTIPVQKGKVVQQTVTLTPGFATMFQFPEEVMSLDLANSLIVHCERSQVDATMALCKPKVAQALETNIIVTTRSNKFNLLLTINPQNDHRLGVLSFVFPDNPTLSTDQEGVCPAAASTDRFLEQLPLGLRMVDFERHMKNNDAVLKTHQVFFLADDVYLTFTIENRDRVPFEALKADVAVETLGGWTGLAVTSESLLPTAFQFSSSKLESGEKTAGVVRFRHVEVDENQSLSLRVLNKKDKKRDLYFRFRLEEM